MSKQWGHGYNKGVKEAIDKSKSLVGSYFLEFNEKELESQGVVTKDIGNNSYMVTLFSFLDGSPCKSKILTFDEIKEFTFFSTDYDMRIAYYRYKGYSQDDIEWSETVNKLMHG